MAKTPLIIVSGPPGTGKTTLGRRIAGDLRFPFLNKDGIKESLFDTLGWSDREWSKRLGVASYAILYDQIEAHLRAGAPLVVESNFHPAYDDEKFMALHERYDFDTFQVQCVADGDVLYERFQERSVSGERHPGHTDDLNQGEFEEILRRGRHDPLAIGGELYEIDMTDLDTIDHAGLDRALHAWMERYAATSEAKSSGAA